ncbi:hypothetical protein ACWGIU_31455 [Streptomyces sp. NPDC054840]
MRPAASTAAQLGDGQFHHRAVALSGVDDEPDGAADGRGHRRHGVVAEREHAAVADDLAPVAPVRPVAGPPARHGGR